MADFVLQFDKPIGYYEDQSDFLNCQVEYMGHLIRYASLLKQPLTLGMFVPCDENGNVLEETKLNKNLDAFPYERFSFSEKTRQYHQAQKSILFEGFYVDKRTTKSQLWICDGRNVFLYSKGKFDLFVSKPTIEDLVRSDLILTKSAIKQIGL